MLVGAGASYTPTTVCAYLRFSALSIVGICLRVSARWATVVSWVSMVFQSSHYLYECRWEILAVVVVCKFTYTQISNHHFVALFIMFKMHQPTTFTQERLFTFSSLGFVLNSRQQFSATNLLLFLQAFSLHLLLLFPLPFLLPLLV